MSDQKQNPVEKFISDIEKRTDLNSDQKVQAFVDRFHVSHKDAAIMLNPINPPKYTYTPASANQ